MVLIKTGETTQAPALHPRTLLLFDPTTQPQSWNERITDGEFAVLYSGAPVYPAAGIAPGQPFCDIFPSLATAERHAAEQIALHPTLRCRLYDHHGLGRPPLRELRGAQHKAESDIGPRFRRWVGSLLFFGGIALTAIDVHADYRYGWPSMLGTRMIPTGLVLLFIDAAIHFTHWHNRRKQASA